ncbi:MAG: hypothetical protein HQL01_13580, partial [Nitrospirae bacterium]|nr:hypothetical protein [Nitrospirota bacterium]
MVLILSGIPATRQRRPDTYRMDKKKYPSQVEINGSAFLYEKVLKEDFFSVNV